MSVLRRSEKEEFRVCFCKGREALEEAERVVKLNVLWSEKDLLLL